MRPQCGGINSMMLTFLTLHFCLRTDENFITYCSVKKTREWTRERDAPQKQAIYKE